MLLMFRLSLRITHPSKQGEHTKYAESKVRKTITHKGSERRRQHVYFRLTEAERKVYNQVMGGFKHFLGPTATGAEVFAKYGLPAMKKALKDIADAKKSA